jgi:hypothetical protein
MSRGPGRIERAIRALLDAHPDLAFVTDELAEHCYPDAEAIARKHQVSVLRAAWNVLKDDPDWTAHRISCQGGNWVFFNRDSAISCAAARGIGGHTYRSEKRASRKRYDWFQRDRIRYRKPYGTRLNQWRAQRGEPLISYDQRSWQRVDLLKWLDSNYGRMARDEALGEVVWHSTLRDADEATRTALLEAEHSIWLQGYEVWADWRQARQLWATKPAVWLKRYQAATSNGKETHTPASKPILIPPPSDAERLAAKARALVRENDPDTIRDGLGELAHGLDRIAAALDLIVAANRAAA